MSKNVTADDDDVQWVWSEVNALRNNVKIPFTGQSGAQKDFVSVFLLFFGEEVIAVIVETNKYVEQYIQKCTLKPRSHVRKWEPVTGEEIYVALGLMMLMGIVQMPTLKSYLSKDPFLETPIFYQTMTQDRFELITKFLNFTDNSTRDTYTGPPKLFKIQPILELLNKKCQSAYLPAENIAIDESLTLLTYRPHVPNPVGRGRSSTNPQPERLTGRHFIEKIPPTGKKAKPQR
jgi:hypothetical protein